MLPPQLPTRRLERQPRGKEMGGRGASAWPSRFAPMTSGGRLRRGPCLAEDERLAPAVGVAGAGWETRGKTTQEKKTQTNAKKNAKKNLKNPRKKTRKKTENLSQ